MLTRRIALPIAALTALATLPVLAGAVPAGASSAVVTPGPASRGGPGEKPGDPKGPKKAEEPPNNCPTAQWTVPLEVKGLACILLLPKPEKKEGDSGGGSSGLGGLLG
jgi:anaerobic selenocysteine-containing dehydrogenase